MISCSRCVLTSSDDPSLKINGEGICNHCQKFDSHFQAALSHRLHGEAQWQKIAGEIKRNKKTSSKYDCIAGVSGGVDSTYLVYIAKQAGLNVLCVHLDNGWNSKEAVSNIKNAVKKLGFELYTHVLNWEEFKDIQLSYFKAGVLDLDVPTDHAIQACLYHQAVKHKVRYILNGNNFATEAILPKNFNFDKGDARNLLNIHKRFGSVPIKTFPLFGQKEKYLSSYFYKHISVSPLNMVSYDKSNVKKIISEQLAWKDYGQKHYENVFTRFYQGYILPTRFGIDKRKAHLASLICAGQMTRESALAELSLPIYDPAQLAIDKAFVLNKYNWTEDDLQHYMTMPIVPHESYGVEKPWSHYFGFQLLRRKK